MLKNLFLLGKSLKKGKKLGGKLKSVKQKLRTEIRTGNAVGKKYFSVSG